MNISKSDIVVSTAGRDQGRLFYVIDADETFVTLADGKIRRMEKPKRKKRKHVRLAIHADSHVAQKIKNGAAVLDSELRRDLAIYSQEIRSQNYQGGV